jgi:ATP-dependent Clp protease ATP-binding subunit ClpA
MRLSKSKTSIASLVLLSTTAVVAFVPTKHYTEIKPSSTTKNNAALLQSNHIARHRSKSTNLYMSTPPDPDQSQERVKDISEGEDVLEKYGVDFTAKAANGELDPVIGRDDEIRRAIQILSRRTKNNPVLIGDPGVGTYHMFCVLCVFVFMIAN